MQGKNRRNLAKIVIILLGIFIPSFVFLGLLQGPIYSATSDTVNLQGKIVRNDTGYEGLNITAGSPTCVVSGSANDTCDFRVRYYDASSGGNLLLTEEFSNIEIGEYLGVFNLSLGSDSSPTAGVYSSFSGLIQGEDDVYVEMGFDPAGSNTYTEVFTRMPLEATAYAVRAKYADNATGATAMSWSGLQDPSSDLTLQHSTRKTLFNWATGTGTDDLFTLTSNASATGTGALLNVQTGAGASLMPLRVRAGTIEGLMVDNQGRVGIGTTSPAQKLDIVGNIQINEGSAYMQDGQQALKIAKGTDSWYTNVYVGASAGNYTTRQTALGSFAGTSNTGSNQTALGYAAGLSNTGSNQTALGYAAGYYTEGTNNTAIGRSAFSNFNEDSGNALTVESVDFANNRVTITAHGLGVADTIRIFKASTTGTLPTGLSTDPHQWKVIDANTLQCVTAGFTDAGTGTHTLTPQYIYSNSTALGYNAQPDASNQIKLGDSNITQIKSTGSVYLTGSGNNYFAGNVGVGTDNPLAKLHIKGNQILLKNEIDSDLGFVLDSGSTATYRDVITFRDRGTDVFALEKTATNAFQLYDYSGSGVSRLLFGAGSNSGISMRTTGTGDFSFINDISTRVIIKADGKVGIGTDTPQATLSVKGLVYQTGLGGSTYFGENAGRVDDLSNNYNTGIGYNALYSNTTGYRNIALGYNSLYSNTTGYANTALGNSSLNSNTTGNANTALGYNSLYSNTGSNNTAVGYYSLYSNTGSNNTALGYSSLYSNTTGGYNTALGYSSLYSNTTGGYNTALGYNSLYSNTGSNNTGLGYYSLRSNTTGYSNTAVGSYSLYFNATGYANTALGYNSLYSNTGSNNTAVGYYSLYSNRGSNNTALGYSSLRSNTTGAYNTALGYYSLYSNTTGRYNTALGHNAGRYQANGTALTDPEYSIYIGYNAKGKDNNDNNSIVIGYNAVGLGANTVVLGNDSIVTTALKGTVGIGTTSPITTANTKLHVYSGSTLSNMVVSSSDYATVNMMSGNVSGQGFGDLSVNAYWDGTAWSKRNTSYESWIIGMATRTDSNGKIEFVHSNAGTGFTMTKPMIIKPNSVYFGDYLEVFSGNAKTVSTPFIRASSGNNLVLNGYSTGGVYLNWDATGSGGVFVGDGAGTSASHQVFTLSNSTTNRGRIHSGASDAIANSADANRGVEVGPYRIITAAYGNGLYQYYSNASSVAYRILTTGTAMDLAEWYPVGNIDLDSNRNSTIKKGEILCMDNLDATKVVKCDSAHTNIIGIASTASYTTMGIKDMDDLREDDVEVALTGRVPAIVTSKNGPISIGDFITYSNLRGVGQKATQKVQVVAKALDSFNPSSCTPASSLESIVWPIDENGDNPTRPCYQLPDGTFVGKIMVFPNISVYNPSETYTTINITNPGWYRISQLNGTDDNAKFKINNSSIGSSQNLILSVDTVNEKENINIVSNFVSGGYDISKARINTVNGVKYLEIYLETVNNNRINVSIEGNITNWISTSIEYVENPTIVNKEFSFSGVLFGVSNMLKVEETGLKVGGDLIANTNTANIGDITNRWNDIYAQGTVRLGSSTDSGGIKYNPETKRLELSNDGETWIPIGSPTNTVLLSAQYPGSVVLDGLVNNMGEMTMNNTGLGNASMNYYQWESSESNLNDKEINITYQLPSDFKEWGSGGITLSFATESISALDNKVDLYVYEKNASGYDGISEGNISTVNEKWQTTKIDGSQLNMCNKAEDVCVIQVKMSSSLNNYARVGDIQIKYERTL